MQPWNTLHRQTVLYTGPFLTVEMHHVQLPDGRILSDWPWIITPDFINILVETDEGLYPIFRQTKYAVEGETLAPVGGYIEPGEDPLTAAQRELREELGCEALDWVPLGQYAIDGNRGNGTAHLFLARKARRVAEPCADDLEEQEIALLNRAALEEALDSGQFRVVPWATVVALGLRAIDRAGS
ncbi:MAG TPA: NUDIX hydrolase [Anaerolineaceae bacterium]|nr:NUDIX hydrolase [Anaerolineaceae bacterium]